jgi:FdhE protein
MTLHEIERRYPEWRPWLAEVRELLAEIGNPAWDAAVPPRSGEGFLALPIPLLHACRRRWAEALPKDRAHGHCAVCGAWPGFAEICGVERRRFLRCVRCGAAWAAHALACTYCGTKEHGALGMLVAEQGMPGWAIETCSACRGYLKAFTRLTPCAPEQTLVEDIASVELDLAAIGRGYRRPER